MGKREQIEQFRLKGSTYIKIVIIFASFVKAVKYSVHQNVNLRVDYGPLFDCDF